MFLCYVGLINCIFYEFWFFSDFNINKKSVFCFQHWISIQELLRHFWSSYPITTSYLYAKVSVVFVDMDKSCVKHIYLFMFEHFFVCKRVIDSKLSANHYKLLGKVHNTLFPMLSRLRWSLMQFMGLCYQIKGCEELLDYLSWFQIFANFLNLVSEILFLLWNIITPNLMIINY